jgi:phosphohistidine phosphatase
MGAMAAHLLGRKNFPKPVLPGTVIGLAKGNKDEAAPATLLFYAAPGQEVIEEV